MVCGYYLFIDLYVVTRPRSHGPVAQVSIECQSNLWFVIAFVFFKSLFHWPHSSPPHPIRRNQTVEANLGPNVRSRSRLNHLAITCQEIAFEFTWVQIEPTKINIKKYSTLILTLGSTDIVKYWPNVFLSTGTSSILSTFSKMNYNEQVTVVEKNQYSCVHLFKWKCIKNELQSPRKW